MIFFMKAFKLLYFVIRNRCEGLKRVGIKQVDTSHGLQLCVAQLNGHV